MVEICLDQLSLVGINVYKQLVEISFLGILNSGDIALTLLLDGQEQQSELGRLAHFEISPSHQVLSFCVLERFQDFSIRELVYCW